MIYQNSLFQSVAAGSGGLIIVPHLQAPNTALTGGEFSYNIAGGISTQLYGKAYYEFSKYLAL